VNLLDVVLLVLVVAYAGVGYRQGFVVGAMSTLGLLLGGFLGAQIAPLVLEDVSPGFGVSISALLLVVAAAFGGQALGSLVGRRVRSQLTWQPARVVDAIGGGALSVVAVLLIAWVLGVAASGARLHGLNQEVRASAVLRTVDKAIPGGATPLIGAFNALVDSEYFPDYLEPFASERIRAVDPPPSTIARRPAVARAEASVAKILGSAESCSRSIEGTGFVFAPGRVMTNAHVVAGVGSPQVELAGSSYDATVVYYDSDVDVAVLAVSGLDAPALRFDDTAASGEVAAVLGFPQNGPYDVQPARVRDRATLSSPDIYGSGTVVRDTYSIFSTVRPGNSGGPLVDRQGQVIGVIFAASLSDDETGYALTADQVSAAAASGRSATSQVATGDCAA